MNQPTSVTYTPVQLTAGHFPIVMDTVQIAAGQQLVAGSVLGRVTADSTYKLSASAATDGSQAPSVILEIDIDTTGGAAPAPARFTGEVRGAALTLGAGHTLASVKSALRPLSLFIR